MPVVSASHPWATVCSRPIADINGLRQTYPMALNDYQGEYVTGGTFLYDGTVPMRITIIAKDHDACYALGEAENWLEPDETPQPLGPDGLLYYQKGELTPHQTLAEVKAWIDAKAYGPVKWDPHPETSIRQTRRSKGPWGQRP